MNLVLYRLQCEKGEKKSTLADADTISPIAGRYWITSYMLSACFINLSFPCDVAHFLQMGIKIPPNHF